MSENGGGDGEGPKKPPHLRLVGDKPKATAKLTDEQAKILFMNSPHLEWSPWAKSMGWPTQRRVYDDFPAWAKEKRDIIAREQAESLAETLFSHRSKWHSNVLQTLKDYPEAADAMMGILKKRANDIIGKINDDERMKVIMAQAGKLDEWRPRFDDVSNKELAQLAAAMRTTTHMKHKSLLIDDWTVKAAEMFTDPAQFEAPNHEDQSWSVLLYGGDKLKSEDFRKMMQDQYDVPIDDTAIDVDAQQMDPDPNDETT